MDGLTKGAAISSLTAKALIDNQKPLLIANSDQFIEWDSMATMQDLESMNIDGGILTFESKHPMWSYVKLDDSGFVKEVAEKKPISNKATVGIYYWRQGSDYVKFAEKMISKNILTNGESYICPVYNEAIEDGRKIISLDVSGMWGLGTPETLNKFISEFKYD